MIRMKLDMIGPDVNKRKWYVSYINGDGLVETTKALTKKHAVELSKKLTGSTLYYKGET